MLQRAPRLSQCFDLRRRICTVRSVFRLVEKTVKLERLYQTMGRIAAGLSSMAIFVWLLWPVSPRDFSGEALAVFAGSVVFWLMTEVKSSEEIIFRGSTPNDIRAGYQIISYAAYGFRYTLRTHDLHHSIHRRHTYEMGALLDEENIGVFRFQDRKLRQPFEDFRSRLNAFTRHVDRHAGPVRGNQDRVTFKTAVDYERGELSEQTRANIEEANRLASEAWEQLNRLARIIVERVPEALDEPLTPEYPRWSRFNEAHG